MKALTLVLTIFIISLNSFASNKKVVIVQMLDGIGMEQLKKIDPGFLRKHQITPLKPGHPSITFPALATLATGVSSAQHGVFTNRPTAKEVPPVSSMTELELYKTQSNRLRVPPIWLLAKKMGIEVYIYQWAMADGKWCGEEVRDNPEQVFSFEEVTVKKSTDAVLSKLQAWDQKKDLLIYSYSVGLDKVGHQYGPYGAETINEWASAAKTLEKFITQVSKFKTQKNVDVSLFLLSDHGMYENWLSEAIDFKKMMEEYSLPSGLELQRLKRERMVVVGGYQLEATQAKEIGRHLRIVPEAVLKKLFPEVKATSPYFAVKVVNPEQQIFLESPDSFCDYQSPNFSFKWKKCKIFEGGHHVFSSKVHQKHLDGIFFQPVGDKLSKTPRMQTEFLPLIAGKLGIDLKQQQGYHFCPVEKIVK